MLNSFVRFVIQILCQNSFSLSFYPNWIWPQWEKNIGGFFQINFAGPDFEATFFLFFFIDTVFSGEIFRVFGWNSLEIFLGADFFEQIF